LLTDLHIGNHRQGPGSDAASLDTIIGIVAGLKGLAGL